MKESKLFSWLNPFWTWTIVVTSLTISSLILTQFIIRFRNFRDKEEEILALQSTFTQKAQMQSKYPSSYKEDISKRYSPLSFLNEERKVLQFLKENTYKADLFIQRKEFLDQNRLVFVKTSEGNFLHLGERVYSQVKTVQIDHLDLVKIISSIENDPSQYCFFTELHFTKREGLCSDYLEFSSQFVQRFTTF